MLSMTAKHLEIYIKSIGNKKQHSESVVSSTMINLLNHLNVQWLIDILKSC